jgi:hypothetical protein
MATDRHVFRYTYAHLNSGFVKFTKQDPTIQKYTGLQIWFPSSKSLVNSGIVSCT